ncbi:MAG: peptidase domain-containing ABC transporter, partial [Pseudomonadales bacterium]|nr:peptidase domain-containing ABC transporter [Pseudomonadales bacterium]
MQRLSELQLGGAGRTPVILQSEATECGLACLAMVAAHHGHLEDLSSLRRQFGVSQRGATLKTLMTTATGLALSPRAIRCEADELTRVTLPAVLHWQFNHFVVVTRVSRDKVTIHDPAVGKRQYRLDEVRRSFTG